MRMKVGIENEYMVIDENDRVLDFTNTDPASLRDIISSHTPGKDDPELRHGDIGIKEGNWYLEGDERFDENGTFTDFAFKGIEVRTPICDSVEAAVDSVLALEAELSGVLALDGMRLAIAAINPTVTAYEYAVPLNEWERKMRAAHPEYDASDVSNLTYGPDINMSFDDFSDDDNRAAVRRLTFYGPIMAAFSLDAPIFGGEPYGGQSQRLALRNGRRPTARTFVTDGPRYGDNTLQVVGARLPAERGRIEFKTYDMVPSATLLRALAVLAIGVARTDGLPDSTDTPDAVVYKYVAEKGLADDDLHRRASELLRTVRTRLTHEIPELAAYLDPLDDMLATRRTPADGLLEQFTASGKMIWIGGMKDDRV